MKLSWIDNKTEWEQDGFIIKAKFVIDDCPPLSNLGEVSDLPADGAIRFPGDTEYFNPANPEYAQQDFERYLSFFRDEWYYGGIVVSASRQTKNRNVELADTSLWGIESDSGDDYFSQVTQELATEAIEEARQTLKDLTA